MNLPISISKFSGSPNSLGWAQVHDFTPQDQDKLAKRGRIVAVMGMDFVDTTLNQLETINLGREVLTRLHEEYFGEVEKLPLTALQDAISVVAEEFSDGVKLQIAACVFIEEKVYFSGINGAFGYVVRRGALAKLFSQPEIISGSGVLEDGDTFIIATKKFLQTTPEGILVANLEKQTSQSVLEGLANFIYKQNTDGALAAVVIKATSYQADSLTDEPELSGVMMPAGNGVKSKLIGLIDNLLSVLPDRKIVVHSEFSEIGEQRSKKRILFIGGLLLILLVVSVVFGVLQKNSNLAKSKYEPRLLEAQHQLEEAKSIANLNQPRARELLLSAKSTIQSLENEGIKDPRIGELKTEIATNIGGVAGIYEVEPEMYLDLSLLSSGFKGDQVSYSEGKMLILDTSGKLVSVDIETKKTKIVAGPEKLDQPKLVAAYIDRNYVLFDDRVSEVGVNTKKVLEKDWDNPFGMHAFASNLYILDKGKSEILRYASGEEGFSSSKNWFAPGITVDLSNVVAWSIDGSIWLLTQSGEVEKYTNGNPQPFNLTGAEGNLSEAVDIFADEANNFVYILDKGQGRIVVIDKSGNYKAEYITDKAKESSRVVVSEESGKIILLATDKLYSVDIKH